jgi:predicted nucleotidyltransferase
MANMTSETMVGELKKLLGERLESVVLYGSMAAGDHTAKHSDINLMIVTKNLTREELQSLSSVIVPWVKEGNHPPLLLNTNHFKEFASVFPVEILDIQNSHKILYGSDPVQGVSVSNDHLKVQLQHELQAKFLRLKTQFILTESKPAAVIQLMVDSLSSFLVLFKNSLWLFNAKPLPKKMEALRQLKSHIAFDMEPFEKVEHLKNGSHLPESDAILLFQRYFSSVQSIMNHVDQL